tara:strand:- start:85 stop:627 length:543 start_codon:yes stop_codon:yes gene_type:complete
MCKKNNLKIINIINNDINGSSKQFHISHGNSTHKVNFKKINDILKDEDKRNVNLKKTLLYFHKDILKIKTRLIDLLKKIKSKKQSIHAYGASTKGNVLLQYFGIDKKFIDFVAERNPKKFNLFTPGTNIKIISEKDSRKMRPNYYLVLPWHFKNEILKREKKIRSKGTKFIFPLPKLKII